MNKSLLAVLAWIGPIIGPFLLGIRGESASAFEKFCYVTMIGPLAILALYLRYVEDKRGILKEPDSTARRVHLEEKWVGFRKLLIILLMASCVSVGTAAWLLLRR